MMMMVNHNTMVDFDIPIRTFVSLNGTDWMCVLCPLTSAHKQLNVDPLSVLYSTENTDATHKGN